MENTAKIFKRLGALALGIIMCLSIALPAMAENVEKAAIGEAEYYLVRNAGSEEETETFIAANSQTGLIRTKVKLYNYDDSQTINAVLVVGLFDKATGILKDVEMDRREGIAAGANIILSADMNADKDTDEMRSFVWEGLSSLKPLGNTAPTAPTDVAVRADTVTNSTVELTWSSSIDDTNAVAYYNVYRDGKYVGSTLGNECSFKDVGIEHNTTVTYTVTAVDVVGAESEDSAASDPVTTDDIARLWLGGLGEGTVTNDNISALNSPVNAHNITVTGVTSGETVTLNKVGYVSSVKSHATGYNHLTGMSLGLSTFDFEQPGSRLFATLNQDFIDSLGSQDEVKVIMNYYDSQVIGAADPSFKSGPIVDYASSAASQQELVGHASLALTKTHRWKTVQMTLPTIYNTTASNNSSSLYSYVFKDRFFDFSTRTTDAASSASKNNGFAYTMGHPATIAIGSNNRPNAGYYANVNIQKVDVVGKDYVPYGAVLDFDKQSDTQYVELLCRDGYNMADIVEISGKTAMKLYSGEGDKDSGARYMKLGMSSNYLTSSNNRVIVRITYLDNFEDEKDNINITYPTSSGRKTLNIPRRTNSGEWKTAEFFVEDAAFTDALGSMWICGRTTADNPCYISRVEVIKR